MVPLQTRVEKTTFPPLRAEQLLNTHKKSARKGGCGQISGNVRESGPGFVNGGIAVDFRAEEKDEIVFNCLKVIS